MNIQSIHTNKSYITYLLHMYDLYPLLNPFYPATSVTINIIMLRLSFECLEIFSQSFCDFISDITAVEYFSIPLFIYNNKSKILELKLSLEPLLISKTIMNHLLYIPLTNIILPCIAYVILESSK